VFWCALLLSKQACWPTAVLDPWCLTPALRRQHRIKVAMVLTNERAANRGLYFQAGGQRKKRIEPSAVVKLG